MTTSLRDDLLEFVEKYQALDTRQVPIEGLERILAEHPDVLMPRLELPQTADGYWPGDPRMTVVVRSVYGPSREVVIEEASSLKDALTQALALPFTAWFEEEEE